MKHAFLPILVGMAISVVGSATPAQTTRADVLRAEVLEVIESCGQNPSDASAHRSKIFGLLRKAGELGIASQLSDVFGGASALDCVNTGRDRKFALNPVTGKYVFEEVLSRQVEGYKEKAQALKNKAEHKAELLRRTTKACFDLERTDAVAAYTNPVCQSIFSVSMPNWPMD